ncbi:hypothetical protein BD410DRAFT_901120 [Rickenella mellea]|uniref:Uncharacterized protein n=1 Tax=Rickenella mellea TaxID=50990 RepID=A0A4Y7PRV0_9AGAM|nr:hypothetical protein BD410DRAFT_901120 [Rickenella mellea]
MSEQIGDDLLAISLHAYEEIGARTDLLVIFSRCVNGSFASCWHDLFFLFFFYMASTNNGNDDEPEPEPEQEQRGATVNKTGPWRNINASRGGQTKANKADTSNTISQGGNTGEGGGGNSASGNKSSTQGSGQRNTAPAPKKGASVKMTSVRRVEADQAAELGNPGPLQPVERAIASSGMSVAPPPRPRQPIVSAAPILELPPPTRERRSALDDHHALQPVQKEAAKDVLPVDSVTNDENENEDLDQTNSNEEYEEEDSWQGFAGDKTIVPDDTPVRLAAGIRGAGNATSDDSSEEGEEEVKSEIDSDEFFGASRTVGGTMRGRARDKFCDPVAFDDMDVDVSPILKPLDPLDEATVYFFKSADTDDSMSNTIPVRKDSDLSAVLEELAKYFSPIKKRNSRIYVARTNGWAMKGRYELAVRSHEEIPWRENEAGETYVGIRADMDEIFDRDAAPPPPHSQVSSANASRSTSLVRASRDPSLAPPDESDTPERKRIRDRYAELLGIPDSLRQRHNIDLTYAWAKWECYHKVVDVMNELKKDKTPGKWDPKLKGGIELIDVFVSKTVWYDYYRKQFPRVYAFPHVKKYLSLVEDIVG